MPKINLTYDLKNETPATATPVDSNFDQIAQFINQELIERGGSVEMVAQLKLVGDPVAPLDAASKQYVDSFLPIGIVMMYGGSAAPPGAKWALCNGAELEVVAYQALYDVIQRQFTAATVPMGRFNLPNLNTKFPMGAGTNLPGVTGGSADAIVRAHTHPIDHDHGSVKTGLQTAGHTHTFSDTTSTTSSAGSHQHSWRGFEAQAGAGTIGLALIADDNTTQYPVKGQVGTVGNHSHTVAVSGTTGGQSASHDHGVDLPKFTGASGAASGAAATHVGANLPPFLAINYVMRVA